MCDADCNGGAHYDCLGFSEPPTGDWVCRQPGCRSESASGADVGSSAASLVDVPHPLDRPSHLRVAGRRRDDTAAPTSGRGRRRRVSSSAALASVCDEAPSAAVVPSPPSAAVPAVVEPRQRRRRLQLGDGAPLALGDRQSACSSERNIDHPALGAASATAPLSAAGTSVWIFERDRTIAEIYSAVAELPSSTCGVAAAGFLLSAELATPSTAPLVPVPTSILPASRPQEASSTSPVLAQPESALPAPIAAGASSTVPSSVPTHPNSAPPASILAGISSTVPSPVPVEACRTPPLALSTTVIVSIGKKSRVFVRDARGVIDLSDDSDDSDCRGDGLPSPRDMDPLQTSRASSPAPYKAPPVDNAVQAPGGVTAAVPVACGTAAALPLSSDLLPDATRTLFTLLDRASSDIIDVVAFRWLASQLRVPFLTAPAAVHSIVRTCNVDIFL